MERREAAAEAWPAEAVDLEGKLARVDEPWSPRVVAALNGQEVKVAKVRGTFTWHRHSDADELFLVLRGRLVIRFRDRDVRLEQGQLMVVPRGVEHRPEAEEEAWILLFEPVGTVNTGDADDPRRVERPERI